MPVGLGGERLWLCPTLGGENLDLSGNNCHTSYVGGMGSVVDKDKGGKLAYKFDNNLSKYIQVSNKENFDFIIKTNFFSISLWARVPTGANIATQRAYLGCGVGANDYGFALAELNNQGFTTRLIKQTIISPQAYSPDTRSTTAVPEEEWYHITATVSDNEAKIYLNGVEVASQAGPFRTANTGLTNPIVIGKYTYNNAGNSIAPFTGWQDDIRIFDRTLSPTEIKHLSSHRGIQGSPYYKPPTVKSRVIRLLSGPDTTVTSKLISVKRNNSQVDPSFKAGYAQSPSESAHPNLWDGLIGAWMPSLGVTGGTLRDVSGNENHGTLTNMDAATDWVATSKGLALDFNRTSNYVTTTFRTNYGNTFGYSFWYRTSSTAKQNLAGSYQNGRSTFNLDLNYTQSTNSPAVGFISGFAQFGAGDVTSRHRFSNTSALSLSDGKWHHVCAFVRLGSYATIFFDGKQVPVSVYQANSGSFSEPALDIWLGAPNVNGSTNGAGLAGSLGHAAVYDRILSPQEIQELYVDSLAPFRQKSIRIFGGVGIPTDTSKIITVKRSKHVEPSYKSGYAQSAGESAHPNLWDGMASWVPALGSKGSEIPCTQDKSRGLLNAGVTFSGTTETNLLKNNYLSFDGSDDYMRIYDSSLKNVGYTNPDECLAIRFRRRSLTGTTALFGYLSAGFLGTYGRGFYFDGTTMHCMSETNNNNATITTTVDDNQWHVAIANFGANGSFYLDGKLIGSGNLNSSWSYWLQLASASAHVSPPSNAANAAVDVSAAYQWDRLLTASEIQTLSISPLAPFRKKQQVAFNAYPLTLLQKIRSAAKPTTPVSVRVKHNEKPSYKAGYAKSADESASPHLWDGLVGAWMPTLGVTGETLRDVSGNGHHGTLTGMDAATDWVATSKGLALDMFSPNDSIDAGSMDDFSDELTINIVEKTNANTDGIRISLGSTTACNFGFQNNSNLNLRLFCRPSGQNYVVVNSGAIRSINSFATYSLTFNRGSVKFWKNGKVFSTHSFGLSSLPASTNELTIGAFAGYVSGGAYVRQFTSLQLYNRALSPQEIQELYVDSLAPFRRKAKPIGYQPNKELIGLFKV